MFCLFRLHGEMEMSIWDGTDDGDTEDEVVYVTHTSLAW